jgi:hypothetical protein
LAGALELFRSTGDETFFPRRLLKHFCQLPILKMWLRRLSRRSRTGLRKKFIHAIIDDTLPLTALLLGGSLMLSPPAAADDEITIWISSN